MEFQTIQLSVRNEYAVITFCRIENENSINRKFLDEMHCVLDDLEKNSNIKVIVLEGKNGCFCTGMDFKEAINHDMNQNDNQPTMTDTEKYMELLKRISIYPKVIISKVNGKVIAGGIGIVAASDLAITEPNITFALSEALWGLMPSMVIPYLVRRVGMQSAYRLTLTTIPISAKEAKQIQLVDEVAEDIDAEINRYCQRLNKLNVRTIGRIKKYFRSVWIIDEDMEKRAISMTTQLMENSEIKENISNFINYRRFPWENNY